MSNIEAEDRSGSLRIVRHSLTASRRALVAVAICFFLTDGLLIFSGNRVCFLLWIALMLVGPGLIVTLSNYYLDPFKGLTRQRTYHNVLGISLVHMAMLLECVLFLTTTNQPFPFYVSAPLLVAMVYFLLLHITTFLLSAVANALFDRIRRFPNAYECQNCGYDLRGNASNRCPECGSAIGEEQHRSLRYLRWQLGRLDRSDRSRT